MHSGDRCNRDYSILNAGIAPHHVLRTARNKGNAHFPLFFMYILFYQDIEDKGF